jgi:hypothetical protein
MSWYIRPRLTIELLPTIEVVHDLPPQSEVKAAPHKESALHRLV